jgi:hypothetical protein
MDILLPKNPKEGEIYKHGSDAVYYYRWNGFAWETIRTSNNIEIPEEEQNFSTKEIINESPLEKTDSINNEFKLKYDPIKNSESVYLNGMLQKNGEEYDYVIIGNSIYFSEPPFSGSLILCTYFIKYLVFVKNEIPTGKTDGENSEFFILSTPYKNNEKIFLNGLLQKSGLDYTIMNNCIIFNESPMENSAIICFYEIFLG